MSGVKSYYAQQAQLLENQHKELQRDFEMLQQNCVALNAEFELVKTEYDEKLTLLINGIIALKNLMLANKHFSDEVLIGLQSVEEQGLELVAVMGLLMRTKREDLDELLLQIEQIPLHKIERHEKQKKRKPAKKVAAAKRQN